MKTEIRAPEPLVRLPWALTAAALTAGAALAATGGVTPLLPLLGVCLLATYAFAGRIEPSDWWVHWGLRVALYGAAGFLNANKLNEGLVDSVLTAPAMDTLGQMMAAELVIQAWRRHPSGGRQVASAILLSGLTLAAASQTADERFPRLFVPLYMFFLLLALARVGRGAAALRWAAVAAALGAGAASYGAVWTNRVALTNWGTQYLEGRPAPETTGLSAAPTLGDTFGLRGSARRVLRITGLNGITYLRGIAFDTYRRGQWGPDVEHRHFTSAVMGSGSVGSRAEVTPLAGTDGLLLAPLNSAGVDFEENADPHWARETGGPLRVRAPQPLPYEIIQAADAQHQGPLAAPPSLEERARCLFVPVEVDPGVRALAVRVAGPERDPRRQIVRVEDYLITHHRYNLTIHPGPGDPVSNFLLQRPPMGAHCEYFAASAVLLLRCLGVPTRYVVGYYAHEGDGPGVTAVRQRDAHAWAEAWVAGTGWVTVDATPGDGRPNDTVNSLPPWQRLAEWFADTAVAVRAWILALDWSRVALGLGIPALLALVVRGIWRRLHPPTVGHGGGRDYTPASGELMTLAARFDALLARQGTPCPPDIPWQEHLVGGTALAPSPAGSPLIPPPLLPHPLVPLHWQPEGRWGEREQEGQDKPGPYNPLPREGEGRRLAAGERGLTSAEAFVRAYNRVRFGSATDEGAGRLAALLAEAEREPAATKGDG